MLTRLKVSGFKNLVDLDVHFGPFTCVTGVNGVGKSNLFDAVQFLASLADRSLAEAAQAVRGADGRGTDVDGLLTHTGGAAASEMSFEAEMLVPRQAVDDLGQTAEASITFLSYGLTLARRHDSGGDRLGPLEIVREELGHINLGEAYRHLPFPHRASTWRKSAVVGSRRAPFFISTEAAGDERVVTVHQDGGGGGPRSVAARSLPRTVLSAANAAENPTALVARREMQSWKLLQLDPAQLREPDDFSAPSTLGKNGSHLPATLARLAPADQIYGRLRSRLAELVDDVHDIWIDSDRHRELLTLMVATGDGARHAARALSEGTLRFLALAVVEVDPRATGLYCVEEPENGIHPSRLPAMAQLLRRLPTDVEAPLGSDNPLRQVIVNTHSPGLVGQVPDADLLVAEPRVRPALGSSVRSLDCACLPGTWRARRQAGVSVISRADMMASSSPAPPAAPGEKLRHAADPADAERDDHQQLPLYR
jgi:predicted ATPase